MTQNGSSTQGIETSPKTMEQVIHGEEIHAEELPDNFPDTVHFITADSGAPPYLIKPWDHDRQKCSRLFWAILGLLLWAFFIYYLVTQAMYLASQPTSTQLGPVDQNPYTFPAISLCLTTLNSTRAAQFVKPASSLRGILNGTDTGMFCTAGVGNPNDGIPDDGSCGDRIVRWIDFPFSILPTICVFFNTQSGLYTTNGPGATISVLGRFPDLDNNDLISYSVTSQNQPNILPILNAGASRGVMTKILFSQRQSNLIKNCDSSILGQAGCKAKYEQACVENLCNCKYPTPDNPTTIPGSCEEAFRRGDCPLRRPIFPCVTGSGKCTLLDVCDPNQSSPPSCQQPSCSTSEFSLTTSYLQLPSLFQGDKNDAFVATFVLESTQIVVAQETLAYTWQQFLSSILGVLAGLLGFSVVTCCEFIDNCGILSRKRAKARRGDGYP